MKWQYWVILNIIVTASWAVFSKLAKHSNSSATASLSIITIAWISCFCTNIKGFCWPSMGRGMIYLVLAGIFGGLTNITYYRFIDKVSLHKGILYNELYILIIPILSYIVFKDAITAKQGIGILLGFMSIYLISV